MSNTAEQPVDALGHDANILIIGCGLLGTSLGLALAPAANVYLRDISPTNQALARDLGAGNDSEPDQLAVDVVIVAVPPDVTASCIDAALREFPTAIVTDVASVKSLIATELEAANPEQMPRYIGSHPMAGRERSGPDAADADLFIGRPWVIATRADTEPRGVHIVRAIALRVGAAIVMMDSKEHDAAVAAVSHVPQIMSSLTASCLRNANPDQLALAGQGLRDTTRIAASDPKLWSAIILYNAPAIATQLQSVQNQIEELLQALAASTTTAVNESKPRPHANGSTAVVSGILAAGNNGVAMIPGKHGGAPRRYAEVTVLVPDEPGQLAQLLADVGELGINLEDFGLEHSHGAPMGAARLAVTPAAKAQLVEGLSQCGWQVVNR